MSHHLLTDIESSGHRYDSRTSRLRHADSRPRGQLWALLALIVYTPLPLASNRPWALALLGLLTGLILLWVVWLPAGNALEIAWKRAKSPIILSGLWIGLLGVQLIGWPAALLSMRAPFAEIATLSIDPYSTGLYLAKALILFAAFWLVVTLIDTQRRIELLARVVVISGLLQALTGVVLMASGTTFQIFFVDMESARAHGTFVSPNQYAGYLEMTLAMGIGLMIAKLDGHTVMNWRQRLHGWLAVLLTGKAMLRLSLIIMVVGLVASRSRGGNSAFFASLLIIGVVTVILSKWVSRNLTDKHATKRLHSTVVFITSLIVLDVIIIGGVVGVEKVVQRIESTNLEKQAAVIQPSGVRAVQQQEQSVEERGEAAIPSLQIVRNYPWLGTGGGTYHLAFPHYRPADVRGYFDHPHNDFVEFASETGLTGLLLLAMLLIHSLWQSFKLLLNPCDQFTRGMLFAGLMGVTSLLIHGMVDFNFQNPANAMLFLILLSMPYLLKLLVKK
ncbi:MAG TPA: hypothetical protein DE312_09755 [Gallionella sp.]|nr:hypothetical protein [Gallionella sp.]